MSSELDALLASEHRQGTLLSQGVFTLDLVKQAEKHALFHKDEPALFLLRGVQAAVSAGAPRICISLRRNSISLEFPSTAAELKGIPLEAVVDSESGGNPHPCLAHLRAMLLGAVASHPENVTFEWLGQESWSLRPSALPAGKRELDVRLSVDLAPLPWWKRLLPARQVIEMTRGLVNRCWFCPVPVYLDSRLINDLRPHKHPWLEIPSPKASLGEGCNATYRYLADAWSRELGHGFCLMSPLLWSAHVDRTEATSELLRMPDNRFAEENDVVSADRSWGFVAPEIGERVGAEIAHFARTTHENVMEAVDWNTKIPLYVERWPSQQYELQAMHLVKFVENHADWLQPALTTTFVRGELAAVGLSSWVAVTVTPRIPGLVLIVKDGVLLDAVAVEHHGLQAILAGPSVTTDLSGLRLVEDPLQTDFPWLSERYHELLAQVRGYIFSVSECELRHIPVSVREAWRPLLR